jgi:integrase
VVKIGKTPVLEGNEWRTLLESIPTETLRDLRDRALIATLTYSFARINAALNMKVEDLRPKGAGWQVQLHEKGGKQHAMPCYHSLAEILRAYIDAAGIADDRKGWLFRTSPAMSQSDAWRMIRRRAVAAGINAPIGNHTFRATGITPISAMAERSNTHNRWPHMKVRARPSSTTVRKTGLLRTKSRGLDYERAGLRGCGRFRTQSVRSLEAIQCRDSA